MKSSIPATGNLKRSFIGAVLLSFTVFTGSISAEEFSFWVNRYGNVSLITTKGKEKLTFVQEDKQGNEERTEVKLKPVDKSSFSTPGGTIFVLQKLEKPVVKDGNRKLNSGSWKLSITTQGKDYAKVSEPIANAAFGDPGKVECYGEKAE